MTLINFFWVITIFQFEGSKNNEVSLIFLFFEGTCTQAQLWALRLEICPFSGLIWSMKYQLVRFVLMFSFYFKTFMILYMFESVLFIDPLSNILFFNFPSLINSFGLNIAGNLVFNNSLFILLILTFYVTLLNVYLLFQSQQ